jgi:acetylglutamate kinase
MAPNVNMLIEALPYIREFRGKTFVVRCAASLSEEEREALCRDVAMLRYVGVKTVVVHPYEEAANGGDDATSATYDARQRANHRLVHDIGRYGNATGLSGSDGAPRWLLSVSDTGALTANEDLVEHVIDDYTPVIEAVAVGPDGDAHPADPDLAAAKLAVALGAYKVLLVVGHELAIVQDAGTQGKVSEMRATDDVASKIKSEPLTDGALEAGLLAVEGGVRFAHLLPSDIPHALLLELFTDPGYGTKIRSAAEWSAAPDLPSRGYTTW